MRTKYGAILLLVLVASAIVPQGTVYAFLPLSQPSIIIQNIQNNGGTGHGTYNQTLANNVIVNSHGAKINFINGTNTPINLVNDTKRNQINVTISSTGGAGGGVTSLNALTGALTITCVSGNTTCSTGASSITINTAWNVIMAGGSTQTVTKQLTLNNLQLGGNANGNSNSFTGINNLNATKVYQNSKQVIDTLNQGTAISISGSGNTRTIDNNGVTSATAGTGIALSAGSGAITISSNTPAPKVVINNANRSSFINVMNSSNAKISDLSDVAGGASDAQVLTWQTSNSTAIWKTSSASGISTINSQSPTGSNMIIGAKSGNLTFTNATGKITVETGNNIDYLGKVQKFTANKDFGGANGIDDFFGNAAIAIRNTANTFATTIAGGAVASNQTLNLPVIRQTETIAVKPQINFTSSSNKTGTTSLVGVFLGDGITITPQVTGRTEITVSGYTSSSVAADGALVSVYRITGACQGNGAALSGTALGQDIRMTHSATTTRVPFSITIQDTGLTINQKYCYELRQAAITGGTATVFNVMWAAKEI